MVARASRNYVWRAIPFFDTIGVDRWSVNTCWRAQTLARKISAEAHRPQGQLAHHVTSKVVFQWSSVTVPFAIRRERIRPP